MRSRLSAVVPLVAALGRRLSAVGMFAVVSLALALARPRAAGGSGRPGGRRRCRTSRVRAVLRLGGRGLPDAGMSTAEYAVGTVAAVAFAVVLYKIVRSPAVSSALTGIIRSALSAL